MDINSFEDDVLVSIIKPDLPCPGCGADSYVFLITIRAFSPVVSVCKDCGMAWTIRRGSLAGGRLGL